MFRPAYNKNANLKKCVFSNVLSAKDLQLQHKFFSNKEYRGKIQSAICNAGKQIAFEEHIKASAVRWPIERCIHEGKD
jgi:hypothetical protein